MVTNWKADLLNLLADVMCMTVKMDKGTDVVTSKSKLFTIQVPSTGMMLHFRPEIENSVVDKILFEAAVALKVKGDLWLLLYAEMDHQVRVLVMDRSVVAPDDLMAEYGKTPRQVFMGAQKDARREWVCSLRDGPVFTDRPWVEAA